MTLISLAIYFRDYVSGSAGPSTRPSGDGSAAPRETAECVQSVYYRGFSLFIVVVLIFTSIDFRGSGFTGHLFS